MVIIQFPSRENQPEEWRSVEHLPDPWTPVEERIIPFPAPKPSREEWTPEVARDIARRRAGWRAESWDNLIAEALVWRGLRIQYTETWYAMDEDDPERQVYLNGIEYAEHRLQDILAVMDELKRIASPDAPFPWPAYVRRVPLDFAALKERIDLAEAIERMTGQTLNRRGRQWTMHCPLPGHDDGSPSFTVSPSKQVWFCHGCQRGGDVFTFTQELHQLVSAGDALRMLAQIYPAEAAE